MSPLPSSEYQQIPQTEDSPSDLEQGTSESDNSLTPTSTGTQEVIEEEATKVPLEQSAWSRLRTLSRHPLSRQPTTNSKDVNRKQGYYKLKYNKLEDYQEGMPRLAALMDSSESLCMFRRYGPTTARLLLHLEIELDILEKQLHKIDLEDASPGGKRYRLESVEFRDGWDPAQKEILDKFNVKIREYYDLLEKYFDFMALGGPSDHDHQSICNWIGKHKPLQRGEDSFIVHIEDLVSAKKKIESSSQNSNRLEDLIGAYASCRSPSFITRAVDKLIKNKNGEEKTEDESIRYYSAHSLSIFSQIIMVFLAVSFLLIPVFLLFLVKMTRPAMTLTVLAFVLAFAVVLITLTQAKAHEILMGTAAYGAFLVVFLGNMNSCGILATGSQ